MVNFGVGVPTEGFPFLVLLFFLLLPLSFSASLFIIFSHVEAIGPVCAIFLNFAELACNSILVVREFPFSSTNLVGRERERESGGQETIRVSICLSHQLKEAEDSLAAQTLCLSANACSKDTKKTPVVSQICANLKV